MVVYLDYLAAATYGEGHQVLSGLVRSFSLGRPSVVSVST